MSDRIDQWIDSLESIHKGRPSNGFHENFYDRLVILRDLISKSKQVTDPEIKQLLSTLIPAVEEAISIEYDNLSFDGWDGFIKTLDVLINRNYIPKKTES